jgi:hypothetical protein
VPWIRCILSTAIAKKHHGEAMTISYTCAPNLPNDQVEDRDEDRGNMAFISQGENYGVWDYDESTWDYIGEQLNNVRIDEDEFWPGGKITWKTKFEFCQGVQTLDESTMEVLEDLDEPDAIQGFLDDIDLGGVRNAEGTNSEDDAPAEADTTAASSKNPKKTTSRSTGQKKSAKQTSLPSHKGKAGGSKPTTERRLHAPGGVMRRQLAPLIDESGKVRRRNYGRLTSTCYISVGLQAIFNTPELRAILLKGDGSVKVESGRREKYFEGRSNFEKHKTLYRYLAESFSALEQWPAEKMLSKDMNQIQVRI